IKGYKQFEYLNDELKDVYALADIVISRAGANAIMEILALSKPNILIPLASGSRGDQLLNAASFEEKGYSMVIKEEALDPGCMIDTIDKLYENREEYIANMKKQAAINPVDKIIGIILEEV
ncbi:MAG: glycosyltransferase, partial [Lachnospiraceae bacterium]